MQEKKTQKKVLLKITHLKQFFPLKKEKGVQLFVRANDDISLDIYEGETLGIVGESGCGKSTFGRVLLQLYHQTDGKTMYYGRTIHSVAPKYVKDIFLNIDSKREKLRLLNEKKRNFLNEYETFSQEEKLLKKAQKDTLVKNENDLLLDIAKLIGGFVYVHDIKNVMQNFLKKYDLCVSNHILTQQARNLSVKLSCSNNNNDRLTQKIKDINEQIENNNNLLIICEKEIQKERDIYKNEEIFLKGETYLDSGIDLAKLDYKEMRDLRRDLQIIFQDPYSSLNPRMTVGQIIGEGLLAHNLFKKNDCNMQKYVISQMEKCGLSAYMINRYPHQFSGGQRQRIGIARSLSLKPKFVICDEAVSALDVSIQSQIINLLQDLKEKENLTYLFISHDLSVVKYISDRIGVMYLGSIVELASSEEIFSSPLHPYTRALLLAIPTTDVINKREVTPLQGDIPSPINPPTGCKFHTRCQYCTDICKTVSPQFLEVRTNHFVACHHSHAVNKDKYIPLVEV